MRILDLAQHAPTKVLWSNVLRLNVLCWAVVASLVLTPAPVLAQPATQPSASGGAPATNPVPAASAEMSPEENEVIITANRTDTPAYQVGSSATVITGEELARKQIASVADALRTVPGVSIARSGGPGQTTSAFMRGADSDQALVLIDGIPANDPSSPGRGFDFASLTTDDIDRIEVLRGPQSTLWGSDAMAGVINIITKHGQGPPTGYLFSEAGSFNTFREGAGISGGDKNINYSFALSQLNTQGFSAADAKFDNPESDGDNKLSIASHVGFNITDTFDIGVAIRYLDDFAQIDNSGGPGGDNKNRTLHSHDGYIAVAPHLLLFDGLWEQTWNFTYTRYERKDNQGNFNTGGSETDDGEIERLDWQHNLHLADSAHFKDTLTGGLVLQEEEFNSNLSSRETADTVALYLQQQMSFFDRLFLTGGFRNENDDRTSPYTTYRFTGAYVLPWGEAAGHAGGGISPAVDRTRFHASDGTGFKSPSLYELFGEFGSTSLRPEKSDGFDAGVEQTFFHQRLTADATYFHNHFEDLIDYNFTTNRYDNIGAARTQGAELSLGWKASDRLTLRGSYTYTSTEDLTTGLSLLRRPMDQIGFDCDYRLSEKVDITLDGIYVSSREDLDPVTFDRKKLGGYTLVNLAASYRLNRYATIYGRIENLLNQHYEEVAGYGTASIGFYAGIKLQF